MIVLKEKKEELKESLLEKLTYNAKEASECLGICERSLWSLTKQGKIPSIKIGRRVLYSREVLRKFVAGESLQGSETEELRRFTSGQ